MASSNTEVDIPECLGDFKIRHSNDKCHTCAKKDEGGKLLKCSKCHWALYCDAFCQKSHWDIHKPECKVLRTNPKRLATGSDHQFDHVREVMECIRRAGLNHKVATLCLTQMYYKAEGKNVYLFEEPIDAKDFQNMVWSCRRGN